MTITTYAVTGMTCSHCEAAVRSEVGAISGVDNVQVNAETGLLQIESSGPINEAEVLAAVDEAGYEATTS